MTPSIKSLYEKAHDLELDFYFCEPLNKHKRECEIIARNLGSIKKPSPFFSPQIQ